MVKEQKIWKVAFYKNDDSNGGAMKVAINKSLEDCRQTSNICCQPLANIVIHSHTKKHGRMWGYTTPEYLLKLLEKNYGIYEVITKFPHKVFFDIDGKTDRQHTDAEFENWMNKKINYLSTIFTDPIVSVSGSNTENKMSIHITFSNYLIRDEEDRKRMKYFVKYIRDNIDKEFDHTVYTKNRNMKAINQSKEDGRIQKIVMNEDYKSHCITCFIDEKLCLPLPEFPVEVQEEILIAKSKKTFDLGTLPKLNLVCPDNIDLSSITSEEVLSLLPNNSSCDFAYRHLVCRFCYTNNIDFKMFFAWIVKRFSDAGSKYSEADKLAQWTSHWKNIHKFPPATIDNLMPVLKCFYPHIAKDIHFRKFSQTFEIPPDNIRKIETINSDCFAAPEKSLIFNVGMGGGKTEQTISSLKFAPNFIWIAPNRALGTNTKKRFEDKNIDVAHYDSFKTYQKKQGVMKNEQKIIVCLNSIHYLTDTKYKIVVIDEPETLLDKFLGDFLEGDNHYKMQIWKNFISMLQNAERVILLDAFITSKTINLIKQIGGSYVIYQRICEPQTRVVKYMDDDKSMLQDIINNINKGSKCFIFYPYKKNTCKFSSMENIYNVIQASTGKQGTYYNADVDDKVKSGLKDVNTAWGKEDFVITNNIVTCGVNYENRDYDYVYIFVASHNTPRDIIQVSYRIRHVGSGLIKICYMGKMNQLNTWLNDCHKMNSQIYTNLYNDILIEKKAPIKRAIQLFCVKANYKQTTDDFKINQQIENDLKKMLENQNASMTYESIRNIDPGESQIIEDLCFAQQATMWEKFMLNKFYFKKSFLSTADESTLAEIWNDNYFFFFKRLSSVLLDENHIFREIASANQLATLFPIDVQKIKLTEAMKDRIFKEFSFKFITKLSSTTKIVKEIYNTYFGKQIIQTEYDNSVNQNIKYIVDEKVYEYDDFAKNNLILDSITGIVFGVEDCRPFGRTGNPISSGCLIPPKVENSFEV